MIEQRDFVEESADLHSFPFEVAQCLPLWECLLSLPPDAADYGQIAVEYPFSARDIRAAHGWIIGARSPSYQGNQSVIAARF